MCDGFSPLKKTSEIRNRFGHHRKIRRLQGLRGPGRKLTKKKRDIRERGLGTPAPLAGGGDFKREEVRIG